MTVSSSMLTGMEKRNQAVAIEPSKPSLLAARACRFVAESTRYLVKDFRTEGPPQVVAQHVRDVDTMLTALCSA